MESDNDGLLIRRRQVADDRFHTLRGIQGVLWALSDLWREQGLSSLFWCGWFFPLLPLYNSNPLIVPLQVAVSLCHPSNSKVQLLWTPFSPYLCPTPLPISLLPLP